MPRAPRSGRLSSLLLMAGLAFAATFTSVTSSSSPLSKHDDDVSSVVVDGVDVVGAFPTWSLSSSNSNYCSNSAHDDTNFCPPPCQTSDRSKQCLHYLQDSHKEEVCGGDVPPQRRRDVLHRLRMPHCCEHAVDKALPEDAFHGDSNTCHRLLTRLIEVDNFARILSCNHADLLTRYDCSQNYSIVHNCKDCKEAYRRWVCSSLVPHYTRSGERMRPCLRVCQNVEQQCPYLLPDQTVSPGEAAHPTPQYAGEPTFLCLDPNIPETGEQRLKSSRGEEDCCYSYCLSAGRGTEKQQLQAEDIKRDNGRRHRDILNVCEHCPGRPPNSSNPYKGGSSPRTFNKVFLLWTAWITFLQTERLVSLLVMCEYGIRTMIYFSRVWRHSCS
ncbi:uncharacterized protein LOC130895291 [Diorhabda carinulata]|uniref:uncharacterized protein LOC130895291 n=1 Tax=Diorhabda carinulata TaxID=1163345 RepID=UPI0025A27020|nr:uncharacterized protein LOC130895291 [Diorhabda carinulata]